MQISDKRKENNDLDRLGDLSPGVAVEFTSGLGSFTESLRKQYRTGFVLDRKLLLPEDDTKFEDRVPMAFFSGEFAWIDRELTVRCIDATVVIDHFDPDGEMPFVQVMEKKA